MSGRLHTSGNGASGEGMHSRPHANIVVLTTRARALLDAIDANENRGLDEVVSDLQDVVAALRSFYAPIFLLREKAPQGPTAASKHRSAPDSRECKIGVSQRSRPKSNLVFVMVL